MNKRNYSFFQSKRNVKTNQRNKKSVPFRWTRKQNKDDLIYLFLVLNNKYILKNPVFQRKESRTKKSDC